MQQVTLEQYKEHIKQYRGRNYESIEVDGEHQLMVTHKSKVVAVKVQKDTGIYYYIK